MNKKNLIGKFGAVALSATMLAGGILPSVGHAATPSWLWTYGYNKSTSRHYSDYTHSSYVHGAGIIRSDGVKTNTGLKPAKTKASATLAPKVPLSTAYHKFNTAVPSQFRGLEIPSAQEEEQQEIIENEDYFAYVELNDNEAVSFVIDTLNPNSDSDFQVQIVGTDDGVIDDEKMIIIDDKEEYKEEIEEIVDSKNLMRGSETINYDDVLNEIQEKLQNYK